MSLQEQKNLNTQIQESKSDLKFLNKLFTASSLEEILSIIYKKTYRRFKIRSIVLYYSSGHFGPVQYICHSKGVYKQFSNKEDIYTKRETEIKIKDKKDSQYLADSLGRPVQNILRIPIGTSQYGADSPIYLFVEFCVKNPDALVCFYKSILELIVKSLDLLLVEEHLQTSIELWTSTFNGLQDPLAIFDEQNNLKNSNNIFDIIFKNHNSTVLYPPIIQWKNKFFKKYSYCVDSVGYKYTIYHYVDITNSLNLRNQMIQNIKMSALGELGESIAHQLNNPLTGVLSMAQLISNTSDLSKDLKQDMQDIIEGVSRSQNIISNLLDFSRADNKLDTCDLNEVVKKTLPLLKSIIVFSDFSFELCPQSLWVKVQSGLLQQVVFNLVKNACQAVSDINDYKQQVKIHIHKVKNQAILYVEDNGKGINSNDYEKIFKPFFTTKQKNKGTGLGLNISRSIVESFKGKLQVGVSSLGGACFTMSLPLES